MAQTLNLSILGLITDPNQLGAVPVGAQAVCDNIVIDRLSIAESRRGQKQYGSTLANLFKLFCYQGSLLANHGTSMSYDLDDAGTWSAFTGTFSPPEGANRIRSMEANRNFYITSDEGIRKLESISSEFRPAGVPPALGVRTLFGAGFQAVLDPSGFLQPNFSVNYRVVWGYTDVNKNEIVGAPSEAIFCVNVQVPPIGVNAHVEGSIFIPAEITTQYFYRLYRSAQVDETLDETPSDELQLVIQGFPSATDLSNGYVSFTDDVPDTERGATLYTSPSQEGILQANYEPPSAEDLCLYKGYAIYANTTDKQTKSLNIKQVGGGGLGVYTAAAAGTISGNTELTGLATAASVVIQDLTYTAVTAGYEGNSINVSYIVGVPPISPGAETVLVSGNSIVITIANGASTATQIKAAFDLSAAAVALASCTVSGTGSNTQNVTVYPASPTAQPEFLENGMGTTALALGMKVTGTGIPANTYISFIETASKVLISNPATATGTTSISFADVVTVAGIKYVATQSFTPGAREFITDQSSTLPAVIAVGIGIAAKSLVWAINSDSAQTVSAYYTGSQGSEAGDLLLSAKTITEDAFSVYSTKPNAFTPPISNLLYSFVISVNNPGVITYSSHGLVTGDRVIITDSNSTPSVDGTWIVTVLNANAFTVPVNVTVAGHYAEFIKVEDQDLSTDNAQKNMLFISKFQQPEAVPIVNFIPVGSANYKIIRVITLNEYVYIFKEQEGLYRLTGDGFENFRIDLFNSSTILQAPESAVVVDNKIYCYNQQSIVAISGSEELVSAPIRSDLLELNSGEFLNFADVSFGINYDSDNKYIFYTVTETDDATPTQAYVYNYFTNTWTRWDLSRSCGIVKPDNNRMYSGCLDPAFVYEERKDLLRSDFADEEYPVTISSYAGAVITVVSTTNLLAGYTLKQDDNEAIILSVDDATTITVDNPNLIWTAGAAVAYTPINTVLEWVPDSSSNPGMLKQCREFDLFFKRGEFQDFTISVQSNFSTDFEPTVLSNPPYATWGKKKWGKFPWGGGDSPNDIVIRTYVPKEKQRASWINFRFENAEAFTNPYLQGISVIFEQMSERFR